MAKGKVTLSGMAFYGYHGYYTEENKLGNHYTVDLSVSTNFEHIKDELEGTINYEVLYQLTEKVMKEPFKLLETLAFKVVKSVFQEFSEAESVHITIKKNQPPIGAICDFAAVELNINRSELTD
jgi:dihydroneopterin aldolase